MHAATHWGARRDFREVDRCLGQDTQTAISSEDEVRGDRQPQGEFAEERPITVPDLSCGLSSINTIEPRGW